MSIDIPFYQLRLVEKGCFMIVFFSISVKSGKFAPQI